MIIGIVTTWLERGASYVSRQYMEVLQKTDEVFIYARGGERYADDNPEWNLPNVHWGKKDIVYSKLVGWTYIDKGDFYKWIKKNQIELLIFNEQKWFIPLLWCKVWGIKTVAYIDYYTESTIPHYRIYDCLICNTRRHAFAFRNNPNVKYIRWGTDVQLFKPTEEKHDGLTFFTSAGMSPIRKGTDYVIRAFHAMPDRRKAKLIVHTQVPLSIAISSEKPLIDELLAEGSLEIVHRTVPAPGLYSRGDVYVYPSRLDGIGLTLMEAASSGLACITINSAPMNEFVDESFARCCSISYQYCRRDGYFWPISVTDVNSLSQIMEDFVSGKENLRDMKLRAREYAVRELDFNKNFSVLHQILSEVKFHEEPSVYNVIDQEYKISHERLVKLFHPLLTIYLKLKG